MAISVCDTSFLYELHYTRRLVIKHSRLLLRTTTEQQFADEVSMLDHFAVSYACQISDLPNQVRCPLRTPRQIKFDGLVTRIYKALDTWIYTHGQPRVNGMRKLRRLVSKIVRMRPYGSLKHRRTKAS